MNNFIYDESRRFKNVFPNQETYLDNTRPYLLFPFGIEETQLASIINQLYLNLSLQYDNSFYRFERIGTIYAKNAAFVNEILPLFERLILLNDDRSKLILGELNYNETSTYATDNTRSENIDGFETDKSISKFTSFSDLQTLDKAIVKLRIDINKKVNGYQVLMLNNINYERGDIYE